MKLSSSTIRRSLLLLVVVVLLVFVPFLQMVVADEGEPEEQAAAEAASLELNVFECVAPKGDPAPKRTSPVPAGSIMTLCFKPKNTSTSTNNNVELKAITKMQYSLVDDKSINMNVIQNNKPSDKMTRVVCPFMETTDLCITATKLHNEKLFIKNNAEVIATGDMLVQITSTTTGDEQQRTIPFSYKFNVEKGKPPPPPIEHVYFDLPSTPPSFPCSKEIRIWIIAALVLTLLEFAFTPSSSSSSTTSSSGKEKNQTTSSGGAAAGGGEKKKRTKKE